MKGYTLTLQQGKVIKGVCKKKGIKLKDLARRLDIEAPHLSNTLVGERTIQPPRALQLHRELGLDQRADFLKEYYSGYVQNHILLYLQGNTQASYQRNLEQIVGPLESSLYDAFSVHYQELGKVFVHGTMDVKADILSTLGDLYRKYESVGKGK